MDKEQAVRMLGFRDAKGTPVDPTTVLDLAKPYRVCLCAEDGSWKPTSEELSRISDLLKGLGIKGGIFAEMGTGGIPFFNKRGAVICRFTESRVDAPPPPKKEAQVPAPVAVPAPAPVTPTIEEKKSVQAVVDVAKKDPEGKVFVTETSPTFKKKKPKH